MALVLRYYAEMSYDEIAETLGVRRAFVGVLLLRARHQLREILGERRRRSRRLCRRKNMNHFDEMTGLLYLEGQLAKPRQRLRSIARTCRRATECRGLLHALEKESIWLREALSAEEEPIPARVMAMSRNDTVSPWAWACGAGGRESGAFIRFGVVLSIRGSGRHHKLDSRREIC